MTNDTNQEAKQHKVRLILPWQDVLFNDHGRDYEHENDWLGEQVVAQWEEMPPDADVIVLGYQPVAVEEGFIVLQVTVEVDDNE